MYSSIAPQVNIKDEVSILIFLREKILLRTLIGAVILVIIAGCSSRHYKAKADKEVYEILDSKWQEKFGSKTNYKIDDTAESTDEDFPVVTVPDSGVLNLADSVKIATAQNRGYQTQKERLYLSALDLTLTRHRFSRQWFGLFGAGYTRNSDDEEIGYDVDVGFDQLLANGTAIGANIAIDWVRFLTGDPRTSLGSVLSTSFIMPLLRGRGREVAQENLTQAERNTLYQIRSFNRFKKEFVVSTVGDYFKVLQLRDAVTNSENDYKRSLQSKERYEWEAKAGMRAPFEVDQAQQRMLDARDRFVGTKQRYQQQLDEFKITLSLPTDANIVLDQTELLALDNIGVSEPNYMLESVIQTALVNRLDLANTKDQVDDAGRKVVVAANNLGAELNLIGSATAGSKPDIDITRIQFHEGTYSLGIEGDFPLDRKTERNAYREALITFEQRKRAYENEVDEVKLDVRQAYRQLAQTAQQYEIRKISLELSKRRVESTELFLETGDAKIRDLLDAQDDLLIAQDSVTAALIDHLIAKLNFYRDVGILQVRPDGIWEQDKVIANSTNHTQDEK